MKKNSIAFTALIMIMSFMPKQKDNTLSKKKKKKVGFYCLMAHP
jgi:hypothetical protein